MMDVLVDVLEPISFSREFPSGRAILCGLISVHDRDGVSSGYCAARIKCMKLHLFDYNIAHGSETLDSRVLPTLVREFPVNIGEYDIFSVVGNDPMVIFSEKENGVWKAQKREPIKRAFRAYNEIVRKGLLYKDDLWFEYCEYMNIIRRLVKRRDLVWKTGDMESIMSTDERMRESQRYLLNQILAERISERVQYPQL